MAEIMHEFGGYCFVDFSASAPYVKIDMHPQKDERRLDAIFFSPHKFLGGPGASGVLVFTKELYLNRVPDHPGGGTVTWTDPWGGHHYYDDIETREDGGTPGFLQGIKAALAIVLKEEMGIDKMAQREDELKELLLAGLSEIPGLVILEPEQHTRLGYISFFIQNVHHNLIVRLLNDRYGIQTRGGCSCAGTYGHVLFQIDYHESKRITHMIDEGDLSRKPGWVRVSLHPTMRNSDVDSIVKAIKEIVENHQEWGKSYKFDCHSGDFLFEGDTEFKINLKDSFKVV
jgi:selenocysteine lyase/cysteine desulfurase